MAYSYNARCRGRVLRGALRGESPRTREGRRPDRPEGRQPLAAPAQRRPPALSRLSGEGCGGRLSGPEGVFARRRLKAERIPMQLRDYLVTTCAAVDSSELRSELQKLFEPSLAEIGTTNSAFFRSSMGMRMTAIPITARLIAAIRPRMISSAPLSCPSFTLWKGIL